MKVLIVGGAFQYAKPFEHLADDKVMFSNDPTDVYEIKPDLMIFTGGEDVTPSLYGERRHPATRSCQMRDMRERTFYGAGQEVGAKMVGICRGAQFLTVMNGGKLVQHIHDHGISGTHTLELNHESEVPVEITSTHHQCMYPFNLSSSEYVIIAHSLSTHMEGVPEIDDLVPPVGVVPEIVWYDKTNCLCIQGHPEYMDTDSSGYLYVQFLIENLILEKDYAVES